MISKSQGSDRASEQSREQKGVRESPVAPKISIADAKPESHDIKVGNDGTKRSRGQNPFRPARAAETGADAESRHRM
jgi:hypothetical protein